MTGIYVMEMWKERGRTVWKNQNVQGNERNWAWMKRQDVSRESSGIRSSRVQHKETGHKMWGINTNIRKDIESHVRTCPQCQKYKKVRLKYGKLPEKQAKDAKPWKRVDLDMIGP
jgi:hypothetical protein